MLCCHLVVLNIVNGTAIINKRFGKVNILRISSVVSSLLCFHIIVRLSTKLDQ